MTMSFRTRLAGAAILLLVGATAAPRADEGFWPYNAVPKAAIKKAYGFDVTDEWLKHVQLSSVRFGGASGSFVSPDGLVMTNHHVGRGAVQQLSTPERDLIKNGFYAKTRAEELKVPAMELNVLQNIEDVTARVNARGQGRHVAGRRLRRAAGGDRPDREGVHRRHRPAELRGHALPGRPLPPLPLQEVHRRPAGVRARARHRVLRRRPGQLRVPALRPRHHHVPRLRERQAGEGRALPEVLGQRHEGRRPGVHLRPPRRHAAPQHRGQPRVPPRRRAADRASSASSGCARRACATARWAPSRRARCSPSSSASRTASSRCAAS